MSYICMTCNCIFEKPKRRLIDGDIIFSYGREIKTKEEVYTCPQCKSEYFEEYEQVEQN